MSGLSPYLVPTLNVTTDASRFAGNANAPYRGEHGNHCRDCCIDRLNPQGTTVIRVRVRLRELERRGWHHVVVTDGERSNRAEIPCLPDGR